MIRSPCTSLIRVIPLEFHGIQVVTYMVNMLFHSHMVTNTLSFCEYLAKISLCSFVTADNYHTHSLRAYIQSLTTGGSRLFGSVVEHWIIDPAARGQFPPKSWEIFQPNLLCIVLCYGFHVIRVSLLVLASYHIYLRIRWGFLLPGIITSK